jgi:outer membrane receptor protein involved in Fe transport
LNNKRLIFVYTFMTIMTKRLSYNIALFLFFIAITLNTANAQMPGGRPGGGAGNFNQGRMYGKVLDANGKAVDAASVQLIQNKFDTATKQKKDVIIGGMLTQRNGEFSIDGLNVMGQYKFKITAIGYKPIEKKVAFEIDMGAARNGDMSSLLNAIDKDLGNIKLEIDATTLTGVVVKGSTPTLTMNIDRKVFNVDKNLTSVGGTAIDVMKNVPSVNVDIDGGVSLRNATPQIFVDGRPTTLSLEQIPADAIQSVEIITNPSAKFDASGGGSGILNIVLKKNRKAGYNGNIRAGIDSRPRPNLGFDFNVKQGKINTFIAANLFTRKNLSWVETDRVNRFSNATSLFNQNNAPVNEGLFGFARGGFDYFVNNRNTISIAANFVRGKSTNTDFININRDTTYIPSLVNVKDYGNRSSDVEGNFRNLGLTFGYKHNFAKAGKEITADVNYNRSKNDNESFFETQYFNANNTAKTQRLFEDVLGGGKVKNLVIQTDFVNPLTKTAKLEMGLRAAYRKFESYNENYERLGNVGPYLFRPDISSEYEFDDIVLAAYTTYSKQLKKWTIQLGVRAESSEYEGTLITRNQQFSNKFPVSLFPSAFVTYKLKDNQDVQFNYSRKINRPNFFQLIPFFDYSDPLNISVGNPNLIPEFTNLIELGYSYSINKNHSILATLYGRLTNDLITRYQYKDKFGNDSVFINSYINANKTSSIGLELTAKNKLVSWWDVTSNINFFNQSLTTGAIVGAGTTNQLSWFAKINNNIKLPKSYSLQISADYQAKSLLPTGGGGGGFGGGGRGGGFGGGGGGGFGQSQSGAQGFIKANYAVDIAIRKDFLKNNAASLTLQVNDVFRTKINANFAATPFFEQTNARRRDPQLVRLNFSYRFGKMDVSLFKRKNMRGEVEGMSGAQQAF